MVGTCTWTSLEGTRVSTRVSWVMCEMNSCDFLSCSGIGGHAYWGPTDLGVRVAKVLWVMKP